MHLLGCAQNQPPHLLITGCGRSGTHAINEALNKNGIGSIHEMGALPNSTTVLVAWMLTGPAYSAQYWRGRQHSCYAPVVKLHREPLGAIASLADGFTGCNSCEHSDEWDAVSWQIANLWLDLPFRNQTSSWRHTSRLPRQKRLALALHYWVGWNQLGDAVATHTARIESVTTHAIVEHWCGYCAHAPPVPSRCACHRGMDLAAQPRQGHGEPSGSALTWQELHEVDARMAAEAMVLARKYGYASQATQDTVEEPEQALEDGVSENTNTPMAEVLGVTQEAETLPLSTAVYAADPSAHLFEGRIYVYCSHDSPTVVQGLEVPHFNMVDYVVLSRDARGGGPTTVHADVLKLEDVPWASGKLWAPDAAYKDGTYYLFLPAQDRPSVFRIGVAT